MKIAVVTPYYRETVDQLRRCHESVKNQTIKCVHYLVSDGNPMPEVDEWDCVHIKLPRMNDYGDTPRLVGTSAACTQGADAISLLDGDNWFDNDHIETLLRTLMGSPAPIVTCSRKLIRPDLSYMADCIESDGQAFNDTNCLLMLRQAFPLLASWGFKDPRCGIVGDRVFWEKVKASGLERRHSPKATVNYVTTFGFHYHLNKETPPPGAKDIIRLADGTFKMVTWEQALELARLQKEAREKATPPTG